MARSSAAVERIGRVGWLPCVLLSGAAFACGCQREAHRSSRAQAAVADELPAFAKVTRSLYRGGQPTRAGYRQLRRMGVSTIVSLRTVHPERRLVAGLGFRHVHLSVKHIHPEQEDVLAFLKVATAPELQPVFVHCQDGVDRTSMMVAVYRIVVQRWSREAAIAEMKRMGFHRVWDPLEDYVERLDAPSLREQLRAAPMPKVELIP